MGFKIAKKVVKVGDSLCVILDKNICELENIEYGDMLTVEIKVVKKREKDGSK